MTDESPAQRMSEWLRVLLDEIERRKAESEQAREERQRRSAEPDEPQEK